MSDLDAIIKKIKALQARAADAASTEAEAAMALKIAAKLLADHDLTMTEVEAKSAGVKEERWSKGGKHRTVEQYAWRGVEMLCNVRVIKVHNSDAMRLIGSPADVAAAMYFFDIVSQACKSCWETYFKTWDCYHAINKHGSQRGVSQSFKIGVATRLGQRMQEMARAAKQEQTSQGTGLVVVKNALIDAFIADKIGKVRSTKDQSRHVADAKRAGLTAAEGVNLSRGFGGSRPIGQLN